MEFVNNVTSFLNKKVNEVGDYVATSFHQDVIDCFDEYLIDERSIKSPIEQMFWIEWQSRLYKSFDRHLDFDSRFELFPQYQNEDLTGKYRIDFAVSFIPYIINTRNSDVFGRELEIAQSVKEPLLGIELDGHAFHEKTKEQVIYHKQRERFLISKGWKLLRFSGTEVYKTPEKCVDETLEMAYPLAADYRDAVDKYLEENQRGEDGTRKND